MIIGIATWSTLASKQTRSVLPLRGQRSRQSLGSQPGGTMPALWIWFRPVHLAVTSREHSWHTDDREAGLHSSDTNATFSRRWTFYGQVCLVIESLRSDWSLFCLMKAGMRLGHPAQWPDNCLILQNLTILIICIFFIHLHSGTGVPSMSNTVQQWITIVKVVCVTFRANVSSVT